MLYIIIVHFGKIRVSSELSLSNVKKLYIIAVNVIANITLIGCICRNINYSCNMKITVKIAKI